MIRSIRLRLTLSYVALTMLAISLVGAFSLTIIKRQAEQQEAEYLSSNAQAIGTEIKALLDSPGRSSEDLQELIDIVGFLGNIRLTVRDGQNRVIAISEAASEMLRENPMLRRMREIDRTLVFPRHLSLNRFRGNPPSPQGSAGSAGSADNLIVTIGEHTNPVGFLEISDGPDFSTGAVQSAGRAFLLAALGTMVVAVLLGLIMGKRLTSPILSLSSAAQAMGRPDWSVRAPDCGRDEIGELARQFNLMAGRLESSYRELAQERDTLTRFIQDASHELRTPLAAVTTFNELLRSKKGLNEDSRDEFLRESRIELEKLAWIVGNLLNLTRLEAGISELEMESCRPEDLIDESWNSLKTAAGKKGIELTADLDEAPELVLCDRKRFVMALGNLLDNAVKASDRRGKIEIGFCRESSGCRIWVRDEGGGIDPEELPRVFDRFYRSPKNGTAGSGLGLALVRGVVHAHGGTIEADSRPGEGSRFAILLPDTSPNTGEAAP